MVLNELKQLLAMPFQRITNGYGEAHRRFTICELTTCGIKSGNAGVDDSKKRWRNYWKNEFPKGRETPSLLVKDTKRRKLDLFFDNLRIPWIRASKNEFAIIETMRKTDGKGGARLQSIGKCAMAIHRIDAEKC